MQFDNKIFWINYQQGTSGAFISLILAQLLRPELSQIEDFPDQGHADENTDKYVKECLLINPKIELITDFPLFAPGSTTTDPLQYRIVDLPYDVPKLIITDHNLQNFKHCQAKFPNAKHLIITVSQKMLPRMFANFYYKCIDRPLRPQSVIDKFVIAWNKLPARRGLIKNLPLFNMPQWAVQELVQNQTDDWPCDPIDYQPIWRPETRYDTEIESTIWRVDLWRIMHDSEQLLEELAAWVDQPVNDIARATWQNYLSRQQELLPWVEDK